MYSYTECYNCGSIWSPGTVEYDWQKCSTCGWTPGDPIDEWDDYDDDDYDEYPEPSDLPLQSPRK